MPGESEGTEEEPEDFLTAMVITPEERSLKRIEQERADELKLFQGLLLGNIRVDRNDDNEDDV